MPGFRRTLTFLLISSFALPGSLSHAGRGKDPAACWAFYATDEPKKIEKVFSKGVSAPVLFRAVRNADDERLVIRMLDAGASVDVRDKYGYTPLMELIKY